MTDCKISSEFNPAYYRSIFGDDPENWAGFIEVTLRTYREGFSKLKQAAAEHDMSIISEVRHALGPSLHQWGAVSLEQALLSLTVDDIDRDWPPLEPEFEALLAAIEQQ